MTNTADDLRYSLAEYHRAHGDAERAYSTWNELHRRIKDYRAALLAQVTDERNGDGKPAYSNAEKRELEVQRRMEQAHGYDLAEYADADTYKRTTTANLERTYETLKSLRALLLYETADIQLRAAEIAAHAAVSRYEPLETLPF